MYTVVKLRDMCKNNKIRGYSRLRKSELIDLLRENDIILDINSKYYKTESTTFYELPEDVIYEIMTHLMNRDIRSLGNINKCYIKLCNKLKDKLICDHADICECTTRRCCRCMDMRSDEDVLTEPVYIDGKGNVMPRKYMLGILRDTGYCNKCTSLTHKVKTTYKKLMI
uniref:Rho termination factor n=1 Tax=Pithovirus LCPAC101 TaxID=2506586 RepID=A0A481Z3I9_9VIRU|nr:MAG: Rho termination factor [Pithovirus LCPAC101]